MAYFQRNKVLSSIIIGGDFDYLQNNIKFLNPSMSESSPNIGLNPRFYGRTNAVRTKNCENSAEKDCIVEESYRSEAEDALFDYLYVTRSFPYIHAEYLSSNSPFFIQKLLEKLQIGVMNDGTRHSISRYLQYHPINEFEPFFESSGLKPYEFIPILPRKCIYLADYSRLLQNYSVLCNYGIHRNIIGRIYMEATEVFSYDGGILESKLQAFEDMGLHRSSICKFVTSTPIILIDDGSVVKFAKEVNILGIEKKFFEAQLKDRKFYNLAHIVNVVGFISKLIGNQNHVRELFLQHPDFLFEESGNTTFSLIGFLMKCGFSMQGIPYLFQQFPNMKVEKFMQNMRRCYAFLRDIDMEDEDIKRIVQHHTVMLGSCSVKVATCICDSLGSWKYQTREVVKEDPNVMMNWVIGSKIERLPSEKKKPLWLQPRPPPPTFDTQRVFLIELGFINDSIEMGKVLKHCHCQVHSLEERVEVFLKAGCDRKGVVDMMKKCPILLSQKKEVIQRKIDILVGDFGIPMSSLIRRPWVLFYAVLKIKLRFTMYGWLKNQGAFHCNWKQSALKDLQGVVSSVLACSEKTFVERFVNCVPRGPRVWEQLKKQIYE